MMRAIEIETHSGGRVPPPAPEISALVLGTKWERDELRRRSDRRLEQRLGAGLVEEVERLRKQDVSWKRLDSLGLEYRFVARFLREGIETRDDLFQELSGAIGKFAKRQLSWFRRMERRGIEIHWIEEASFEVAEKIVRLHFGQ